MGVKTPIDRCASTWLLSPPLLSPLSSPLSMWLCGSPPIDWHCLLSNHPAAVNILHIGFGSVLQADSASSVARSSSSILFFVTSPKYLRAKNLRNGRKRTEKEYKGNFSEWFAFVPGQACSSHCYLNKKTKWRNKIWRHCTSRQQMITGNKVSDDDMSRCEEDICNILRAQPTIIIICCAKGISLSSITNTHFTIHLPKWMIHRQYIEHHFPFLDTSIQFFSFLTSKMSQILLKNIFTIKTVSNVTLTRFRISK